MRDENNYALQRGMSRGAAASTAIIKDMKGQSDMGADYCYGYLANHISGLLGYAAAIIGHDSVRELVKQISATVDMGLASIESGASTRVN
ncbi:hypothetical protein [Rhodanobacter denitrificans]|uniref:Uncharacterized protein n=1 Tax=Rhodanobacter denitrificans TaxID=666685 RepID=M4NG80_9GAMM|nr:hypothetical protein [Rhodanobacter denitrificans]AGG89904.1 hypothetical protein R2APBS1_2827 [Rhodanobacter denitrificans]UJM85300.1 hypothetical protein LRJ86_10970 [Rhodanobacter denitrificans]